MTNQEPAGIYQEEEDYREGLVHTQAYGYKTVTVSVTATGRARYIGQQRVNIE